MSEKILVGFGVLRTHTASTIGKTFCTYPHVLYSTREEAGSARDEAERDFGTKCTRFDVVEVHMAGSS